MSTALALPTLGASRKLASTPAAAVHPHRHPVNVFLRGLFSPCSMGSRHSGRWGCFRSCRWCFRLHGHLLDYPRRRASARSLWIWAAFIFWVIVCTVSLEDVTDYIAWTLRFVNILNAGVYALYYFNAKESISINQLLGSLTALWVTVVVLGWGGVLFPEVRVQTPMSYVVPQSFMSNSLVKDYMLPPFAEVQNPWGAPEPYVRPAAPFPYANSWGLAFTVLTPVMFAFFARTRSWLLRIFLAIVLGASVVPLVATSNRGMFIGLGFATAYVIIRLIIGRYWGLVTAAGVMVVGVVTALIASGTVAAILGRQQYSDSTGGRAALYRSTWAASLESPIVGYGTPRMELSVGVSMGTQGYLWTLMFCFGFVGLAIYALFILSILGEGLKVHTPAGFWLHSIPVCSCVVIIFYSFDVAQLSVLLLSAMACIRAQYYREELLMARHASLARSGSLASLCVMYGAGIAFVTTLVVSNGTAQPVPVNSSV